MLNFLRRLLKRPAKATLDEDAILRQTRKAFAGELPIARERLGDREVLTIEPETGHTIVVGSSARGTSASR